MALSDYDRGKSVLEALARNVPDPQIALSGKDRVKVAADLFTNGLGWPASHVALAESEGGRYAEFLLGQPATRLIVEVKREGTPFAVPPGLAAGPVDISVLVESDSELASAIAHALTFCQNRGVPLAAVSNGSQLVAFVASRQDSVPPLSGRALVFPSMASMRDGFAALWSNLSRDGVESLAIHVTLGDTAIAPPPAKLAASIPEYPGYWKRNRIQNELKILGDLVLQDIATAPELEQAFLEQCYSGSAELSEYALVSREILEARYSVLDSMESEADLTPARDKGTVSDDLQTDVLAGSIAKRPLILLGDVGVGKSMFIRHFVRVDAKAVMDRSIVLYINFGAEPALANDLNDYVMESFVDQLRQYDVDVENDKFVRNVYRSELKSFAEGVQGRLKKVAPEQFEIKEIELLERKVLARDRHLQASLRYATRRLGRQVVVFLDNIDQRDFDFQEKVFLIGQSLAETWPATVFLSLRPDTFYRSRNVGSLTAYQPRVFTISPPDIGRVIAKRLRFCRGLVEDPAERKRLLPEALDPQASSLSTYLSVLESSFGRRPELVEFVENLSGGNVRAALGFLNTFVGSGHVDTRKIFGIAEETGDYTVALHEFVRAIMYGDYQYFDPSSSLIANVFEISLADRREHFLLPVLLAQIERLGDVGRHEGFVDAEQLLDLAQSLGFTPSQLEFALRHGTEKRLLQRPAGDRNVARRFRITTVGAYTYRRLMGTFVYLDAVVVDTPVTDDAVASQIVVCHEIEERLARAYAFEEYLNQTWHMFEDYDLAFDWSDVSAQLATDYARIRRVLPRQH